jgi:uncharacterized caspase-like protein
MPTPHTIRTPLLLQCIFLLLACLLFLQAAQAAPDKRVALLIGNAKYTSGMPRLVNPPQDVAALEASLKKLNFSVQVVKDADQKGMGRALKAFGTQAQDAQIAFFYYSGHGMQARDENFLIPVGAAIDTEVDLDIEAISLRSLMRQLEEARPQNAFVILDACRDNPVAGRTKSGTKGLGRVQSQPTNTLVVFAALAGNTASDNGVFAKALASHITQPNVGMRGVFDNVNKAVKQATDNKQSIERNDQLSEDVYLLGPANAQNNVRAGFGDADQEAWDAAKAAHTAEGYGRYLRAYPKGRYAEAATIRQGTLRLHVKPGVETIDGRYQLIAGGAEVLDASTGLIWQRCVYGSTWSGDACTGNPKELTYVETQQLSVEGWRVPIRNELVSLMQTGKSLGTLNTKVFPGPESSFWSSSLRTDDPRVSWYVNYWLGIASNMTPDTSMNVRLVR